MKCGFDTVDEILTILEVENRFEWPSLRNILWDVASERALWQLVEMAREARLDEDAYRGKRVLGSNVPFDLPPF